MASAIVTNIVGSNFGFMWGTFWVHESSSTISALLYLFLASLGAGQFVNLGSKNVAVKIISTLTPMRYAVERTFRRIVQGQKYDGFILNLFGFKYGD